MAAHPLAPAARGGVVAGTGGLGERQGGGAVLENKKNVSGLATFVGLSFQAELTFLAQPAEKAQMNWTFPSVMLVNLQILSLSFFIRSNNSVNGLVIVED